MGSKSMFAAERRNSMEIMMNILEESKSGINKTRLVYRTNLNFLVIRKYMDFLIGRGLLRVEQTQGNLFVTTDKGTEVLTEYNKMRDIMGFEKEIEAHTYL